MASSITRLSYTPTTRAMETADELKLAYEDYAIVGARAALRAAATSGDPVALDFWSEVAAILATDETITVRLG